MVPAPPTEPRLHNRLALLRALRGLSRRQVAESVEVHVQTIGFIERGQYPPSLALAFRLSALFEVPIEQIFSPEPFPAVHLASLVQEIP